MLKSQNKQARKRSMHVGLGWNILEEIPSPCRHSRDSGMGGVPMKTRLREWWQESCFPDRRQAEVCGDLPTSVLAQGSDQDPGRTPELLLNLGACPLPQHPVQAVSRKGSHLSLV